MTACVFCQIVRRELEAYEIHRDDQAVVFLDKRPLFPGHCLIIPAAHHETLTDLPGKMLGPFFALVQRIVLTVMKGMNAAGTFVAVNNTISQSVPHLHVHVVPRNPKDGLKGFFWPRYRYEGGDEMERVRRQLVDALKGISG